MKKAYTDPEIQIRKYSLPPSDLIMTISGNTDLGDGDHYGNLNDLFK